MRNLAKTVFLLSFSIFVGSCATTTTSFKQGASASRDFVVDENYQAVYRRLANLARCTDGAWAGLFASFQTDAQLYPELGSAEVSHRMTNVGVNNYYWLVEINEEGQQARVQIFAGNTLGSENAAEQLEKVARGTVQPDC